MEQTEELKEGEYVLILNNGDLIHSPFSYFRLPCIGMIYKRLTYGYFIEAPLKAGHGYDYTLPEGNVALRKQLARIPDQSWLLPYLKVLFGQE